MPKFNVGDRVKILSVNTITPKKYIGTTGVVQEVSNVPYVRMDIDGRIWALKEGRLELVKEKQKMKVRVTHKSGENWWYDSHIGETFEVIEDSNHHGRIFKRADKTYWWIMPEHCEIVKEDERMFKVGDKVKVVDSFGSGKVKLGDIATVTKVTDRSFDTLLDVKTTDGREYSMCDYRFELLGSLPPEIKTGHLVMTTFDNQWRLAQIDTINQKPNAGNVLLNLKTFCYIELDAADIIKIAEVKYIGDIFRAIKADTPVEQVKDFKIIYDKTKEERKEKLESTISDLQSQLEKAQKELKEAQG